MNAKVWILIVVVIGLFAFANMETEAEKKARLAKIEQQRIEIEKQKRIEEEARRAREAEEARLRAIEEEERRIYNLYINNSLHTGATPYSYCYGGNSSCEGYGCSEIKVRTPYNSDVLVIIKENDKVYQHAYIKAGSSYTFQVPNGTYQPFFYYGRGWNPDKVMKRTSCGELKGGFISGESVGKDYPQTLHHNILQYTLILQENGNFSTKPSSVDEAL